MNGIKKQIDRSAFGSRDNQAKLVLNFFSHVQSIAQKKLEEERVFQSARTLASLKSTQRVGEAQSFAFKKIRPLLGTLPQSKSSIKLPSVEELLQAKKSYLQSDWWTAFKNNDLNAIEEMLENDAVDFNDADHEGETVFFKACDQKNLALVDVLISYFWKIDLQKSDENGLSPFLVACLGGDQKLIQTLLECPGIDVNQLSEDDETPFYLTCEMGNEEVSALLLKSPRVDPNKDSDGQTPFSVACISGHIELVKLLLNDVKIDVNKADESGSTALHDLCAQRPEAMGEPEVEIIKMFLESDRVAVNKTDNFGATPFQTLCELNHSDTVKIFMQY